MNPTINPLANLNFGSPSDSIEVRIDGKKHYYYHPSHEMQAIFAREVARYAVEKVIGVTLAFRVVEVDTSTKPVMHRSVASFAERAWAHGFIYGMGVQAVGLAAARIVAEELCEGASYPEETLGTMVCTTCGTELEGVEPDYIEPCHVCGQPTLVSVAELTLS